MMPHRRPILLSTVLRGSGGASLPYTVLYDDDFTDTDAAPIADPRTCVPGPGVLNPNTAANANLPGDSFIYNTGECILPLTTELNRAGGLAVYTYDGRRNTKQYPRMYQGFDTITPDNIGYNSLRLSQQSLTIYEAGAQIVGGISVSPTTELANNQYDLMTILQAAGAYHLFRIRGVDTLPWTIAFVAQVNTQATLYPFFTMDFTDPTYDVKVDKFQVLQLGAPWVAQDGVALHNDATPTANDTATGEADCLQYISWTVVAAETFEISFRRTDDNNRYIIRCSQSGSTIKLIRVQAGSETELTSAAKTWTATTTYLLAVRVYTRGNEQCTVWDDKSAGAALLNNTNFGTFNENATGCKVGGFTTGANWKIYPLTVTGAALDALPE